MAPAAHPSDTAETGSLAPNGDAWKTASAAQTRTTGGLSGGTDIYVRKQRARYGAIRKKIFGEMTQAVARSRLIWVIPFNVLAVGLLIARGISPVRAVILTVSTAMMTACFGAQAMYPFSHVAMTAGTVGGAICYFVAIGVTGGLASPMIYPGLLMLMMASLAFAERPMLKRMFFGTYMTGFLILGLLHRTAVGALSAPLTPSGMWPSVEFELLTVGSIFMLIRGLYKMGGNLSLAYERVGLELAERREELCSETEDRTRALEGIAARLAHEVKNPLAAIKGLSAHMARTSANPKEAERLQIVAAEADRLQAIVEGFLSFSRGFDDLKPAPTEPYSVARELTLLLETRASDVGVTLHLSGESEISLTADARKLRQALLNLVLNAIQASPRGGKVTLDVTRGALGNVRIKVTDEGPGMSKEVLERIKRPYFTTKDGGTGLGVAVARGIIEQHGGHLLYESSPGRGTTATIELLPCAVAHCLKTALPNPLRRLCGESAEPAQEAQIATVPPTEAPAR